MATLRYLRGDATVPQAAGVKLIAHVCNDLGRWGKGFVLAVSARWPAAERAYRDWYAAGDAFGLGEVQFVQVEPRIWVANMVGQRGVKSGSRGVPIRYDALEICLTKVAAKAIELNASVHMPRIGCGLAGGKWERVEPIVEQTVVSEGVDVFVYDYDR